MEADEVTTIHKPQAEHAASGDEASRPFVGRWNRLVSTTNWEKGRIICQWREALEKAGAPQTDYSDQTWSRLVGCITAQHVGRLRRVHQRFGRVCAQYEGLYWSHFQAAVEWDDAEMWLEGAVHSGWSVSQMRHRRWETLGGSDEDRPRDEDVVSGELDEDFEPAQATLPEKLTPSYEAAEGPAPEGPDFGDETAGETGDDDTPVTAPPAEATAEPVRPLADLAELPEDVAEAFEAFKLAILRHKTDGWKRISLDELLGSLDALKELALAPSAV